MDDIHRGRRLWRQRLELEEFHRQEVEEQAKVEGRSNCFVSRSRTYWQTGLPEVMQELVVQELVVQELG